jgi:P-type Cu2+ transporter
MSAALAHQQWQVAKDQAETQFFAAGMRCANCARAIERGIGKLPGVELVKVNVATARVNVHWHPSKIGLDAVLGAVEGLGYQAIPLAGADAGRQRDQARRLALKRIGLAGLVSMQLSMYTLGLYVGGTTGIEAGIAMLLRVTSMLLTVPVLLYSGMPLLRGAWQDLQQRRLGMDVPVAAALVLAFVASVYDTLANRGEVYYDTVAMFVFFLLIGRYVEESLRRGGLDASEALARSLPASVTRLTAMGSERVSAAAVTAGQRLLVAQGGVVPVDGRLDDAAATLDQSLLSGESNPVACTVGGRVFGGSVNVGPAFSMTALSAQHESMLTGMVALMRRAQRERPLVVTTADRAAGRFVLAILLLSVLVAVAWWLLDPARAFAAVLSVLVVTCPCALSLATPAVVAAASTRLARRSVLVTRPNALEQLAHIDTVLLDKTGTLTTDAVEITAVDRLAALDADYCSAIAAALEQHSLHPIARAFQPYLRPGIAAGAVREFAGQGLEGRADGHTWRIGKPAFVAALSAAPVPESYGASRGADSSLWLGHTDGLVARFGWRDQLRTDAVSAVAALRARGLDVIIASGDQAGVVQRVAQALGNVQAHGQLDPGAKLRFLEQLRQQGRRVLMIGDGINDGPVLAAADVSCAMGQGTAIAQAAADLMLMGESLLSVDAAIGVAREHLVEVRANLRWALAYNLAAVPLAAMGWVPPWLAAFGMSASSLYVVWRAWRFAQRRPA